MSFGVGVRNSLGLGLMSPVALTTRRAGSNAPALAELNFQTGVYIENGTTYAIGSLPGWVFSRSGARYAEDPASGLFATNAPRIVSGSGLRISAGITQLYIKTDDFSNVNWQTIGATKTANAATDPAGGSTAARVQLNAGVSYLYQNTGPASSSYNNSFWVKRHGAVDQTFRLFGDGASDLSPNLTATAAWQRFSLSGAAGAGTNVGITTNSTSGAADIDVWGPQLVATLILSDYAPNSTTSSLVIGADSAVLTRSGATLALVTYAGTTVSATPATPLDLGGGSGGAWVDNGYIQSVLVR